MNVRKNAKIKIKGKNKKKDKDKTKNERKQCIKNGQFPNLLTAEFILIT